MSRTAVWAAGRQHDVRHRTATVPHQRSDVFNFSHQFRKTFASQFTEPLTGYRHLCHPYISEQWDAEFLAKRPVTNREPTRLLLRTHARTHTHKSNII